MKICLGNKDVWGREKYGFYKVKKYGRNVNKMGGLKIKLRIEGERDRNKRGKLRKFFIFIFA